MHVVPFNIPSVLFQDPDLRHKAALVSEDELPSWLLKGVEELEQEEFEENEGRLFGLGGCGLGFVGVVWGGNGSNMERRRYVLKYQLN